MKSTVVENPVFSVLRTIAAKAHTELKDAQDADGFTLTASEESTETDEELHVFFTLEMAGNKLVFCFSLGWDDDAGTYLPYLDVDCIKKGDEEVEVSYRYCAHRQCSSNEELEEALENLGAQFSAARVSGFIWLEGLAACA